MFKKSLGSSLLHQRHVNKRKRTSSQLFTINFSPEDSIASQAKAADETDGQKGELRVVRNQVMGLQGVREGYPAKVSKRQHETKAFGSNVHCGKDCSLEEEAVPDIQTLEDVDHDHGC